MSRKDYQLIAGAIAAVEYDKSAVDALEAIDAVVNSIAEALAEDNPRFNRARFLAACAGSAAPASAEGSR